MYHKFGLIAVTGIIWCQINTTKANNGYRINVLFCYNEPFITLAADNVKEIQSTICKNKVFPTCTINSYKS